MSLLRTMMAALLCLAGTAAFAQVQSPVKIGFITTLSGPAGYLGEDIRDGFMLGVKLEGGKLGGIPVDVVIEDDGLDPGKAKQIAERMLKQDRIKLISGSVFSNVLLAEGPTVVNGGGFYISPNAGPSLLAGKGCHKNLFVVSWQNDTLHEAAGEYANTLGLKKLVILAPNYAAGRDSLTGFKRMYKGEVVAEVYTKLNQMDFSAEMAQIRDAKPDAIYHAHPGGPGISFNKQFVQAGLNKTIKVLVPAAGMEQRMVEAIGDDAIGVINTSQWSPDREDPVNQKFMAEFIKTYGRIPTDYASQAYDTALLIGSALRAVNGNLDKDDDFRAALRKADFQSVRGKFRFGPNNFPIQDVYARVVEKGADGKPSIKTLGIVLKDHQDAYASECKM